MVGDTCDRNILYFIQNWYLYQNGQLLEFSKWQEGVTLNYKKLKGGLNIWQFV